jgi:hypothetical protein
MALQDLTPQLRTRLSRMERAVGWFVLLATVLLVFGLGYYVYQRAKSKGWFIPKFQYQTSLNNAAGIKVGDPVKLMGFTAGEVTEIIPEPPNAWYGVTIYFRILKPHYGYIWDDSKVKVSSDFLGNRFLEITKGKSGFATIQESTNSEPQFMLRWKVIDEARKELTHNIRTNNPILERTNASLFSWKIKNALEEMVTTNHAQFYTNLEQAYWIEPEESPALNDRLEKLANQIEQALPNILDLTNKIGATLENATQLSSNLNVVALGAKPVVSNLMLVTAQLKQPGALGEWLLPTNINQKLGSVMDNADVLMMNANTNLANLNLAIINLADITSNLNVQVQANSNILSSISTTVQNADTFVQGLKRHWFLRSAFKPAKTNAPATKKK